MTRWGAVLAVCLVTSNAQQTEPTVPTINKCCARGQVYSELTSTCEPRREEEWVPPVYVFDVGGFVRLRQDQYVAKYGLVPTCAGTEYEYLERVFPGEDLDVFGLSIEEGYSAGRVLDRPDTPEVQLQDMCLDRVETDNAAGEMYVAKMCIVGPCTDKICVRKCCPMQHAISSDSYDRGEMYACVSSTAYEWHPDLYEIHRYSAEKLDVPAESVNLLYGPPPCNGSYSIDPSSDPDDAFYLDVKGHLYVPRMNIWFEKHEYCVDSVSDGRGIVSFLCHPQDDNRRSPWYSEGIRNALVPYTVASIASQVCLLLTAVVYTVVPQLRNLQGKVLLNLIAGLFGALFFNTVSQLGQFAQVNKALCTAVGVMTHYFFMSTFFWLSVMSYDIWRNLSRMKAMGRDNNAAKEFKKLVGYVVFAWGSPLVISTVTLVMDLTPGISPFYPKPYFAYNSCWFLSPQRLFIYYMGPASVLIVANMVFLGLTVASLRRVWRQTRTLDDPQAGGSSDHRQHQIRLMLNVKLIVVMGVTWVMEVVASMVRGSAYIWFLTDLLNLLQGVFIFVIFVCKKKVLTLLTEKYPMLRKPTTRFYDGSSSGTQQSTVV